jgi:ATP-dependent DNA helicase RecG
MVPDVTPSFPSGNPLETLLAPLRYACQHNFAKLGTVRGLRPLLEKALGAAQAKGVQSEVLAALRAELNFVDATALDLRRESLRRVVFGLQGAGVALPPELASLTGKAKTPVPPMPAQVNAAPRPKTQEVLLEVPTKSAKPKKAPKVAPAKRPKTSAEDAGSEAKLLSIAPSEGPLATELKTVGKRVNPRLLGTLNKKGIKKVGDVLFLLPRVYEDRRRLCTISELRPGERGVFVGVVKMAGEVPVRGGRKYFRAVIADHTGSISATYFMNGPWLKARFPIGKRLVVSGEMRASYSGREMPHPEIEPAEDLDSSSIHFKRIVPVYPGFERHEQRAFRELAAHVAENYAGSLEEPLPQSMRARLKLLSLPDAIRGIHFPGDTEGLELLNRHLSPAHRRLAFDELFFLQLGIALRRQGVKAKEGIAFTVTEERMVEAKAALPFELTSAQRRVVKEIAKDMARPEPMNRLLQGDVGSGKTAVALVSALLALKDGYQVALMAPTEILAEQHRMTFQRLLGPLGYRVGLISASGTAKDKKAVRAELAEGEIHVAVGTHALIQDTVEFAKLGLVIIDEQHRFGVVQRQALMRKGIMPDVLVMTATPIPRTLAMTLYGDLDVSLIDELPPGRTPIETKAYVDKQRSRVYEAMTKELEAGRQAYVVYPLVEESEKLDLADATQGAESVQALFPSYRVGLLHGRMKNEEKDAVMRDFRDQRVQILVCTTVVEVGVDVPNASVMVIEAAERFGLSQLHQLRGRVGRGAAKSFCFLVSNYARSEQAGDRLGVMEQSNDGFVIAEKDLELRGPGEFLGTRQSGLPELAVANLARDGALLITAREEARNVLAKDSALKLPEHRPLAKALEDRWEGRLALARVG